MLIDVMIEIWEYDDVMTEIDLRGDPVSLMLKIWWYDNRNTITWWWKYDNMMIEIRYHDDRNLRIWWFADRNRF